MPISAHRALRTTARGLIAALFLLAFGRAQRVQAQAIIKVSDSINFKVGILMQPQADLQEVRNLTDTGSGGFQQNFLIRRLRFLIGGQVAKNVFFFAETENGNLGKSTQAVGGAQAAKSLGTGFNLVDAVGEWRIAKEFNIQFGEIRVPISREALKGSTSQFMLDFSAYAFPTSAALQNNSERDTGAMLRGYFNCDRLEYRAGVFSGFRAPGVKNATRFTGRLQYNFFDTEVYNFVVLPGRVLRHEEDPRGRRRLRHAERLPLRVGRHVPRLADPGRLVRVDDSVPVHQRRQDVRHGPAPAEPLPDRGWRFPEGPPDRADRPVRAEEVHRRQRERADRAEERRPRGRRPELLSFPEDAARLQHQVLVAARPAHPRRRCRARPRPVTPRTSSRSRCRSTTSDLAAPRGAFQASFAQIAAPLPGGAVPSWRRNP